MPHSLRHTVHALLYAVFLRGHDINTIRQLSVGSPKVLLMKEINIKMANTNERHQLSLDGLLLRLCDTGITLQNMKEKAKITDFSQLANPSKKFKVGAKEHMSEYCGFINRSVIFIGSAR